MRGGVKGFFHTGRPSRLPGRFIEILEEIGNGDHPVNSGRDYAAENKLSTTRKRKK